MLLCLIVSTEMVSVDVQFVCESLGLVGMQSRFSVDSGPRHSSLPPSWMRWGGGSSYFFQRRHFLILRQAVSDTEPHLALFCMTCPVFNPLYHSCCLFCLWAGEKKSSSSKSLTHADKKRTSSSFQIIPKSLIVCVCDIVCLTGCKNASKFLSCITSYFYCTAASCLFLDGALHVLYWGIYRADIAPSTSYEYRSISRLAWVRLARRPPVSDGGGAPVTRRTSYNREFLTSPTTIVYATLLSFADATY